MSTLPKKIATLSVPRHIIAETQRLFEPFRSNKVEGCVLWYGRVLAANACTVDAAIRPRQHNRPKNYAIASDAVREVRALVRPKGFLLIIQIHTHPRRAFFSEWDAANALNKQEGALNMIIPNFGNVVWDDLSQFCMVECDSAGNWIEWKTEQWRRLQISRET